MKSDLLISPQAWGCTGLVLAPDVYPENLPTSVGMYRKKPSMRRLAEKSPHKRGDVPFPRESGFRPQLISPQAWGCTAEAAFTGPRTPNLPTSVGMYQLEGLVSTDPFESPHKRGDVPDVFFIAL